MVHMRAIRVIEYEGDPEWVMEQISNRSVKEEKRCEGGVIREAFLGRIPAIVNNEEIF